MPLMALECRVCQSHSGLTKPDSINKILQYLVQVAGVDLEELIRETKSGWTKDQPVADFQAGTERVQIYLDGLA